MSALYLLFMIHIYMYRFACHTTKTLPAPFKTKTCVSREMKARWNDSGDERIFPSSRTTVPARTRMTSFAKKESLWERWHRSMNLGPSGR